MEIKLFTAPTCTWCKKLKEFLKKKKLSYQELDISEIDTARDELLEKTGQLAVPVVVIAGTYIVGFDEAKLEAALAKAK
ncbi:MAG TPA: glutaredoxin domain-containing protein [Candidatus Nanoarchaeia archaeon]|nr:glutaredoxin domain-containing protein [Candidatus Nanoarchaeia archaeon]